MADEEKKEPEAVEAQPAADPEVADDAPTPELHDEPLPPPPMKPTSTPPEARSFVAKTKGVALVITAIAGLATAVGAHLKPRDDTATKATYDTLSSELKTLSEENGKLHDDLVSLKAYVDGYMRASTLPVTVVTPKAGSTAAPVVVTPPPAPPSPPAPDLSPRPKQADPPPFANVAPKGGAL